jgi:hypothetical protein
VSGIVLDHTGPVAGAVVRIQTTGTATTTDGNGVFSLDLPGEGSFNLTGWAPGYYITGPVEVAVAQSGLELILQAHSDRDNPDYRWLPSIEHPGEVEGQGCAECHAAAETDLSYSLPVDEWLLDAHAQSATNPRFLTMYLGTDLAGNKSPLTRYGYDRDYGTVPVRPDPREPYFGPGYKLDFPETAGNCGACHTPAAAVNSPYATDPTILAGVAAEGVPCDFCHKVWDVRLDLATGLPYPNMPGVLSYEFRRPEEDHQFFAGPFDDVAPGEDTFSPLQRQSQFCAACHFGVFWGTEIYNSFGEWLASPYSDPETGKTCQDCHMPPLGAATFARPDKGGLARDPTTIYSHRMPGAADEFLLQNAVTLTVAVNLQHQHVVVTVDLFNDKTGHHVPTDSPLRHMILLVEATDEQGRALEQLSGPTVPDWAGQGDSTRGHYGGLPGTAYAKILQEFWTEVAPSGAYWNPTRVLSDNRLPAFGTDRSEYAFAAPPGGDTHIEITLLFRRAFVELMEQKGWQVPDIVMAQQTLVVRAGQ